MTTREMAFEIYLRLITMDANIRYGLYASHGLSSSTTLSDAAYELAMEFEECNASVHLFPKEVDNG